jgi:hypothetical protein
LAERVKIQSQSPQSPFPFEFLIGIDRLTDRPWRSVVVWSCDFCYRDDGKVVGQDLTAVASKCVLECHADLDRWKVRFLDFAAVKKDISTAIIRRDEAVALRQIEPFHLASGQNLFPYPENHPVMVRLNALEFNASRSDYNGGLEIIGCGGEVFQ